MFTTEHWNMQILHLKIASESVPETLGIPSKNLAPFLPQRPFDYEFLDARLDFYYREEIRLGQIFCNISLIAFFVACLGPRRSLLLHDSTSNPRDRRTKGFGRLCVEHRTIALQ